MRARGAQRAIGVVALVLALAAGCGSGPGQDLSGVVLSPLGDAAPLELGGAQDRPMVVNIWATTCTPCRTELPVFDDVAAATDEVDVVGVDLGEEPEVAERFVEDLGLGFPQYVDADSELTVALGVTAMPTTVLIDRRGEVARVHTGTYTAAELVAAIDKDLGVTVLLDH